MRVESFRDGDGTAVPPGPWPRVQSQAIAGQLVVTLDTVKKHVSNVLGELGAANHTEAVTRARELSLIP
jgi:Bacterial regulatory proteins, luxR family